MALGGVTGQTLVQTLLDEMMGLPLTGTWMQKTKKMLFATCIDRAVQLGSIAMLSSVVPEKTEQMQHFVAEHILPHAGIKDPKAADSIAKQLVLWQLPNTLGGVGSFLALDRVYARELAKLHEKPTTMPQI
jgi:hypothetical protein